MPEQTATITAFLRSLWGQWVFTVGGGIAMIVATVAGLTTIEGTILATIAVVALGVAVFKSWAKEREKVQALEERLRPKLRCSVPQGDPGCIRPNTWLDGIAKSQNGTQTAQKISSTYFRVRVETENTHHVEKCYGRLLSVKFYDEIIVIGENIDLPFAHSEEDAFSKMIYEGVPEYLDLITVPENCLPIIATKGFIKPSSIPDPVFHRVGLYLLHVVVLTPLGEAAHITVLFDWTGDPGTSTMSK